jgi:hypothetical protein
LASVVLPDWRGPVNATTGKPFANLFKVSAAIRGIIFANVSLKLRFANYMACY